MHDVPLAHDRESFDVKHRKSTEFQLQAYGVGREKADSHACDHRLLDRFGTLDFHRDIELDTEFRKQLFHRETRVRPSLAHDERLMRQFLQRNMSLARKPVLGRRNDYMRLRRERLGNHLGMFGRTQQHGEINRILPQPVQDLLAVVDRELHGDVLVAAAEFSEQAGEKIITGADDGNIEPPAADPF